MKRIENYNLPEHTNNLYMNEAASSIGLAHEIAVKVNELVDAFNELNSSDLEWKQTQEGKIRKSILYMKDNLLNTLHELTEIYEKNGLFDSYVKKYISNLENQLNNIIGSETVDEELLDIRYGFDNIIRETAGVSVRSQMIVLDEKKVDKTDFECITEIQAINISKEFSYTNGTYLTNGSFQDLSVETSSWARDYYASPFIETKDIQSIKWYGNLNSNSRICFYNKNKEFVKHVDALDETITHTLNEYNFTEDDRTNTYFTISFHKTTPEIYKNIPVLEDDNLKYAASKKIVNIGNNLDVLNGIYMTNGVFQDLSVDTSSWARNYYATPLLKTTGIQSIKWYGNLDSNSRICFYDKNKKLIRKVDALDEQTTHTLNEYVFTDNDRSTYYFALSYHLTTPEIRKSVSVVDTSVSTDFTMSMLNMADLVKRVYHHTFSFNNIDGGYMTIIFDDGRHDLSTVASICEEYGIPLCAAIPVNSLDDTADDGNTILSVCKTIVSNGGEILSHGMNYDVLTDATDFNLLSSMLKDSKETLSNHGFNIRGFIKPGGTNAINWNGNNLQKFTQLYYDYADSCGDDVQYYKNRVGLGYTDIETAKDYVDDAISNNKWYTFMSHTLDGTESQLTESWFREFIEYALEKGIKFKTYAYMYDNFGTWE